MSHATTYLTGARVVLQDTIIEDGSVLIEDGRIAAIEPECVNAATEIDLKGSFLLPGLIDLHCDALEKEIEPRPGVFFPVDFAIAEADKRNAAAGITTVFHALSFASGELGVRDSEFAGEIARQLHYPASRRMVDHRVHCRYEITDPGAVSTLQDLIGEGAVHLLSVMDHTPGQGQFLELSAYRDFLARTYDMSDTEAETLIQNKFANAHGASERIAALTTYAKTYGLPIASHDDDSVQRVETMRDYGATISEFPVNLETARVARESGMMILLGAPNVVRGRSQGGALRAIDAISAGVADCLCADYVPAAMLVAPFRITEQTDLSLSAAIALVTHNPARAAGLDDRGAIAAGKRADLIAVDKVERLPHVVMLWRAGQLEYVSGTL